MENDYDSKLSDWKTACARQPGSGNTVTVARRIGTLKLIRKPKRNEGPLRSQRANGMGVFGGMGEIW